MSPTPSSAATRPALARRVRPPLAVGLPAAVVASMAIAGPSAVAADTDTAADDVPPVTPVECTEEFADGYDLSVATCGFVSVPLDRTDPGGDRVDLYVELHAPPGGGPADGTIVVAEGGPGFSTTAGRDYFYPLFGGEDRTRNLLLVDYRGMGRSDPVVCPALIALDEDESATDEDYERTLAACFADVGADLRHYNSAVFADDFEDVRRALGLGVVDMYGDSYGPRVVEAYAQRHPDSLRSVVLESPLPPTEGALAFASQSSWQAVPRVVDTMCRTSPACRRAIDDPASLWPAVVDAARDGALVGTGVDPATGESFPAELDLRDDIADAVFLDEDYTGGIYPPTFRELPAAWRSAVAGDLAPAARLYGLGPADGASTAEDSPAAAHEETTATAVDEPAEDPAEAVRFFNFLMLQTVSCADLQADFPYAYDEPREQRVAAAQEYVRGFGADVLAPLTLDEADIWAYNANLAYSLRYSCLDWPAEAALPDQLIPADVPVADVPTLVFTGTLDTRTDREQGRAMAARFDDAQFVEIPNGLHTPAYIEPGGCAARIMRGFLDTLAVGDTSCLDDIPPVQALGAFPLSVDEVPAGKRLPGDRSSRADRRLAAAVALTAADALQHRAFPEETVHGLRGGHQVGIAAEGTFTETLRHDTRLHGYAFVPGVQVSGTVRFRTTDYATGNLGGRAVAVVTARDDSGARLGSFVVRWRTDTRDATATITGLVPGPRPGTTRTVRAETPAP